MKIANVSIANAMLLRATRLWIVGRVALSGLLILAATDPFRLSVSTTVIFLALCVGMGYLETHINHERDLLANLGVKRRILAMLFLAPAIVGELLVHVAVSFR